MENLQEHHVLRQVLVALEDAVCAQHRLAKAARCRGRETEREGEGEGQGGVRGERRERRECVRESGVGDRYTSQPTAPPAPHAARPAPPLRLMHQAVGYRLRGAGARGQQRGQRARGEGGERARTGEAAEQHEGDEAVAHLHGVDLGGHDGMRQRGEGEGEGEGRGEVVAKGHRCNGRKMAAKRSSAFAPGRVQRLSV